MIPLKYLSNFWRTLEIPLINYEVSLQLKWSRECVFFIWVFFHEHSQTTGLQGKGESISLISHYLHRHLDISWAITAESSLLHIASTGHEPGNFGLPAQVANH